MLWGLVLLKMFATTEGLEVTHFSPPPKGEWLQSARRVQKGDQFTTGGHPRKGEVFGLTALNEDVVSILGGGAHD